MRGEWGPAAIAFQFCYSRFKPGDQRDGPLLYMLKLMDKTKERAPDDWEGAFDMDEKPVPPEFDMDYDDDEEGEEKKED